MSASYTGELGDGTVDSEEEMRSKDACFTASIVAEICWNTRALTWDHRMFLLLEN